MNELIDKAIRELTGEEFIEWLMNYITNETNRWPVIQEIGAIRTKPEKIKKFMLQQFLAMQAFLGRTEGDPGSLRFAIANLSESADPSAESALEILEKKYQDELTDQNLELWHKLLQGLGAKPEEIERIEPKEPTRTYTAELSEIYSSSDWQTAIGTFAAQERSSEVESQAIVSMLKNNTSLSDQDIQIFLAKVDSKSTYTANANHVLDKVVFDLETKMLVWKGVRRFLTIRQEFLNGLTKYLEEKKPV